MPEPTPVEVWAPAFEKRLPERLTAAVVFSTANERLLPGLRWCRLCEAWVPFGERDEHARAHGRERTEWRRRGRREREREATARLRQVNRLRREVAALDRAPGDEASGGPSSGGRPTGTTRRKESNMSTNDNQAEATKAPATASGTELFSALLDQVKAEKVGSKVVVHPEGKYARVFVDEKRHAGYVVPGKTKLNVYPQALAADMPKDLGFKKVKLGAHHYGRGEVIVPVGGESDFGAAIKALKAAAAKIDSAAAPAEAKKAAPAKKRQAQPDPKPGRKSRSRAAAAAKA